MISGDFQPLSEDFPKERRMFLNIFWTFSEDYQRFPKIARDFWGGTDDVSILQQHI